MYILHFALLILSKHKIKKEIEVHIDINNIYNERILELVQS